MIADEYQLTWRNFSTKRAGGIGEHHDAAPGGHCRAHRMGHLGRAVPLVEVETAKKHEHPSVPHLDRPHFGALVGHERRGEARHRAKRVPPPDGAEGFGGGGQSGAEDQSDVMVDTTRNLGELVGCMPGQFERVPG